VITTLSILNGQGDQTITWDHSDPQQVAEARQTVAALAASGYTFFLVDGSPADPVDLGKGTLIVRKLTAAELTEVPAPEPAPPSEPAPEAKRRGRPRKVPAAPDTPGPELAERQAVAVRPLRGG
jgi:hypothetical protein